MDLPVLLLYEIDPRWEPAEQDEAERETRRLGYAMRRHGHSVTFIPIRGPEDPSLALSQYDPDKCLVFNWCENIPGVYHGESLVAETLDALGFTYTGSPTRVLRFCYDKPAVKKALEAKAIPTPLWRTFASPEVNGWDCFPAIVKPSGEHCSFGVDRWSVVTTPDELTRRIAEVIDAYGQPALVEDFINGREFHVSTWGNNAAEMFPPVEMDFSAFPDFRDRLCSYDAKFTPASAAYRKIKSVVPAPLKTSELEALETVVLGACRTVGCRDYSRIDVRLREGVFYVLDVNPNADISADTSMVMAAKKAGYSYGALGSRLLHFAALRHPQNSPPHQ